MDITESKENLAPMECGGTDKMSLILVVVALLVAVVALIIACVGVAQKGANINVSVPGAGAEGGSTGAQTGSGSGSGTGSGSSTSDSRIWTFANGDGQYREADEVEGTLKGFLVDLVNAVCKVGDKNCKIMGDLWTRCWDTKPGEAARGGEGLMGRWYDACPGWVGTFDRHRTFAFTDQYGKAQTETFFVKKGTTVDWQDLTGKTVGILDGYSSDDRCLARHSETIAGVPLTTDQIMHYQTPDDLIAAVNAGDVDLAFTLETVISTDDLGATGAELHCYNSRPGLMVTAISTDDLDATGAELHCYNSGPGLMVRVDSDLPTWWNDALDRLLSSNKYVEICQDLTEEHGHQPGVEPDVLCFLS